jgi:hypothetical protein
MTARWFAPIALIALCTVAPAHAAEPAPTVRVKVNGQQPAVVGQSIQVEVTVLAPNFFLSAPVFPQLRVAGAVATMPDERGINSTETIDGVSYAGIGKTYVLTPQSAGDLALPQAEIHFTYAGDDGKPRAGSVTLPATVIHAGAQGSATTAAARPATSTLPVGPFQITQQFDRPVTGKDAHLHAGDAVVRTITILAPNAPAMMIEPPELDAPRGVKLFKADPQLSDGAASAGEPSGGKRVEHATYVLERSGRLTLPAVTVHWYDPASGKPAQSVAPAVTLEVGRAAPGIGLSPSGQTFDAGALWPEWLDWRVFAGLAGLAAVALIALAGRAVSKRWHAWREAWRARLRNLGGQLPPLNP